MSRVKIEDIRRQVVNGEEYFLVTVPFGEKGEFVARTYPGSQMTVCEQALRAVQRLENCRREGE